MILIAVIIVAIIALYSAAIGKAATTPNILPAGPQNPGVSYQVPQVPAHSSPSAAPGAGTKPTGIVTSNSKVTGVVNFYTSRAGEARGIDISGAVLFDLQNIKDGANSAIYLAGAILDHIDLLSFNGLTRLQVYFPTEDIAIPSTGLVGPTAVGQDASSTLNLIAPYSAGDAAYNLPLSNSASAFDPGTDAQSWYDSPEYQASLFKGM